MRVIIQRVSEARVKVKGTIIGEIEQGFLLLVGFSELDGENEINKLVNKIANMRIFNDDQGQLNISLKEVGAQVLSVSQFTLYADCKKGNRPSYKRAAKSEQAEQLYDRFNELLIQNGCKVQRGKFKADMKVELINDGPVTILLDSEEL